MLQEETLNKVGRRQYEEPEGEFLEMIDSGSNTITVLTRVDSGKAAEVESPFEPQDYSVSEINTELSELSDVYSKSQLKALLDAEKEGKDRKTAKQAIEDRI